MTDVKKAEAMDEKLSEERPGESAGGGAAKTTANTTATGKTPTSGGGGGTGKVTVQDFHFVHLYDKSSAK